MGPNEYQKRAMKKEADQGELTSHVFKSGDVATRFTNGLIGLTDECGELAALRKRWLEYQGEVPKQSEILEECGDILWRTSQILLAFGLTLDQAMQANILKLEKVRYKDVVCNPEDAKEENRDRKGEAAAMDDILKERAKDDGVCYEE